MVVGSRARTAAGRPGALPRGHPHRRDPDHPARGFPVSTDYVVQTPSGAGVFTAGTLRWGCALLDHCDHDTGAATARFVARVTDNVLRGFAQGPVGERHPAVDNVADFSLAPHDLVPASRGVRQADGT